MNGVREPKLYITGLNAFIRVHIKGYMGKKRPYEANYGLRRDSGGHMCLEAANGKETADTEILYVHEAHVWAGW